MMSDLTASAAMAAPLFRGKKGVNLPCTSPASTSTEIPGELDRRSPHLGSEQALSWAPPPPSGNQLRHQKGRRSSGKRRDPASPSASRRYLLGDDEGDAAFDVFPEVDSLPELIPIDPARFRSATGDDSAALKPPSSSSPSSSSSSSAAKEREQVRFGASPSSSSYLPSTRLIQIEKGDGSPVLRPSAASLPWATFQTAKGNDSAVIEESPFAGSQGKAFFGDCSSSSWTRFHTTEDENSAVLKPSSSSARSQDQVVVLMVSLHCKGCESKVRKHISRMKGVTSFSIDFAMKKVTIIGDVTPLVVLSSISKVKSAQFWPTSSRSTSSS